MNPRCAPQIEAAVVATALAAVFLSASGCNAIAGIEDGYPAPDGAVDGAVDGSDERDGSAGGDGGGDAAPDLRGKRVKFADDFESGNFSTWDGVLVEGGGSFTVVTSPVRSGLRAAMMSAIETTTRSEVASWSTGEGHAAASYGEELWYQWDTYVPGGYQWGGPQGDSGSSMTELKVNEACYGGGIELSYGGSASTVLQWLGRTALFTEPHFILILRGGNVTDPAGGCVMQYQRGWDLGAVAFDRWTRLTLHIKWHGDPSVGFVEAWTDATQSIPRTAQATQIFLGSDGLPAQTGFRLGFDGQATPNGSRIAFDNLVIAYP